MTDNDTTGGETNTTTLTALAVHASKIAADLAGLKTLLDMAKRDAPATVPQPGVTLGGYPFAASLTTLVADAREWSTHLATLVEAAQAPLSGAAQAIRDHINRLAADIDEPTADLARHYEDTIRNGLGGVWGDIAAAFSPAVQIRLANLFDALDEDTDIEIVREEAHALAAAYLDARTRDDDCFYTGKEYRR